MKYTTAQLYELIRPMVDDSKAPDSLTKAIIRIIEEDRKAIGRYEETNIAYDEKGEPYPAQKITGKTSDGYHTFDELYEHRIMLFIALMLSHRGLAWRSKLHDDGTMMAGWFIAGMNLPSGMITYHLPLESWEQLKNVKILEKAPVWDGHTPDDVIERITNWTEEYL